MNARQSHLARLTGAPLVVGRYALFDVIGGGGMAQVHLGRILGAAGFSRVVAIKRLHPGSAMDPSFTAMLTDEARLASRIRHPNVVPMLDVVANGKELLLVMEYAPGVSLSRLSHLAATNEESIPQPIVLRLVLDMLAGLEAAHAAKNERGQSLDLVHRDISPQNIIAGADGHARIVDFGIAKAQDRSNATGNGQIKGKLGYMPPEQLCGEPVDRRADIYATGVVLWELLANRRLFDPQSDELMALLRQALDTNAPPPSTYDETISIELDTVVMRAVERDAPNRFATAAEMAGALEALGGAASSKEVAAFVGRLGGHDLAERAELVARVEQTKVEDPNDDPGPSPVPMYTPPPRASSGFVSDPFAARPPSGASLPDDDDPPPTRSSVPLLVSILVGVVLAALILVTFIAFRSTPEPVVDKGLGIDAGATEPPAPSLATAVPEPPPRVEATAEAPSAMHAPTTPHRTPAAAVSPAKASCDPPYLIDLRGIRIPRRECLGK